MNLYRRLRAHWFTSLLLDGAVMLIIFLAISTWQTRNLLPSDTGVRAPDFSLPSLDGGNYSLRDAQGKPVLLYFFAPWCSVCNLSAHNLESIYATGEEDMSVYLIAIGYRSVDAVADYRERHSLSMPILLDDGSVSAVYKISATPTYYIVDEEGRIQSSSVGYSTELGLRLRML